MRSLSRASFPAVPGCRAVRRGIRRRIPHEVNRRAELSMRDLSGRFFPRPDLWRTVSWRANRQAHLRTLHRAVSRASRNRSNGPGATCVLLEGRTHSAVRQSAPRYRLVRRLMRCRLARVAWCRRLRLASPCVAPGSVSVPGFSARGSHLSSPEYRGIQTLARSTFELAGRFRPTDLPEYTKPFGNLPTFSSRLLRGGPTCGGKPREDRVAAKGIHRVHRRLAPPTEGKTGKNGARSARKTVSRRARRVFVDAGARGAKIGVPRRGL